MTSIKRSAVAERFVNKSRDPQARVRNQERLVDSITGSLRVEGYAVKREHVRAQVLAYTKKK